MSNSSAVSTATATSSANRSARRRGRDLGGRPVLTVRGPLSAQVPWRVLILNVALVALIAALAFWGMLQGDYKIASEKLIPALLVVRASLTQAQTAASWLAGSLNDITWERTYALMGLLLVVTPLLLMLVRPLGAIRFGDQVASGLGVSVNAYRVAALFIGVLLVSLATATTGPIAFVALAAPHIAKTLSRSGGVGFTSAALMGALMVLGSDLIGRFAVPGRIIQVGVVTGAIGGLYLIYLIYLERKKS